MTQSNENRILTIDVSFKLRKDIGKKVFIDKIQSYKYTEVYFTWDDDIYGYVHFTFSVGYDVIVDHEYISKFSNIVKDAGGTSVSYYAECL